jgi:putative cell wall-binding protein
VAASTGQGGAADVSRLVDQLREAARELATLRAANARLKVERERAEKAAQSAAESEEARRNREKAASELKVATEELRKLKSAVDRLGEDVAIEKRLRLEAEATASQLREQLRTLARAVNELAAEPRSEDERRRPRD